MNAQVRWPAEWFYWAVLDAPVRRPGPLTAGLLLDLQEHVPLEVTQLHAVGVPLPSEAADGAFRTLACAVPRDALHDLPGQPNELMPVAVPHGIASGVSTERLNLLVGEFEPRDKRRRRARKHAIAMVGTTVVAALIALGLSRRTASIELAVQEVMTGDGLGAVSQSDLRTLRAFAARAAAEPAPTDQP